MYKIETPETDAEFDAYFEFRWLMLRKPWNFPQGSEKDEYEQVSEHRMIRNNKGEVIAIGRSAHEQRRRSTDPSYRCCQ